MPGETVKLIPLLVTPFTVTATGPLLAAAGSGATILASLQLAGLAEAPLKVTLLVP